MLVNENANQNLLKCIFIVAFLVALPDKLTAQVPEIPDPNFPDIAAVAPHPQYGAVIIYNPIICQQIGAACNFFRAHEYGHINLGHHLLHTSAYRLEKEAQADCYAAQTANSNDIFAAVQLFLNYQKSFDWRIYGNPIERANRVRTCAIQAGKWIGK
ncbi:MAG: hypothetical protein AAGF83_21215 [Cyanobacteria bacterium P01_G01_bin.67]